MSEKFHDRFDYENAKRDILDAGGDPDYLSYRDPEKRDKLMRQMGLNPKKYGSKWDAYKEQQKASQQGSGGSGGEGCYIATCVYGSYDCPEVWTLRRFRDGVLKKTLSGRTAVRAYYRISPVLVRCFGKQTWFRKICKPFLDHMVRRLKSRGFEDSPYTD